MVEIRRNARLAAGIAVVALLLGIGFALRGGGSVVVGVLLLLLGLGYALAAWDARTPLVVIDQYGVRMRLGRAWSGLPWSEIDEIEHQPRPSGAAGLWRDGRLSVLPVDNAAQLESLSGLALRLGRLTERLYGVPFAVPLGLGTTLTGAGESLTDTLLTLAPAEVDIVEIDPSLVTTSAASSEAVEPVAPAALVDALDSGDAADTAERPALVEEPAFVEEPTILASPTPSPLREPTVAVRAEVIGRDALAPLPTSEEDLDATQYVPSVPASGTVSPERHEVVFDDLVDSGIIPAANPIVGPQLAAARARVGLSIDQLAERTRIRPHVLESIEVDDFLPCGGDFYARGHLRTIARVLGVDAAPLLETYDATYADVPVDPRAVFQAELASGHGGGLRPVRGGPNWSVLVAAVMAVVLVWSVARLVTAGTPTSPAPQISLDSGAAGTSNPYGKTASPIPVTLTAAGGGAQVVVRDATGTVVFTGDLAFGQSKTLKASPPVRIQSTDGSLAVAIKGGKPAAIGAIGQSAQKTYTAD